MRRTRKSWEEQRRVDQQNWYDDMHTTQIKAEAEQKDGCGYTGLAMEGSREQKVDSVVISAAVSLLRCVYHAAVAGRFFETDFQSGCVHFLADVA